MSSCLLAIVAASPAVWAHAGGIAAAGCEGCHSGGAAPTVTLTASPAAPALDQQVILTITVSQTNGPVAGFFLTSDGPVGTFKAVQAGTTVGPGGVMHTMPHTGSNGVITFQAGWSASQPTGVRFTVYALSANGDGTSRGDAGNAATLAMTAGCPGTDYYVDQDGDGYGTSDPAFALARACTRPDGYATVSGDCNDVAPTIHPGAVEQCNGKDDNCDGQIDEGLSQQLYCRDGDGDGHGISAEGQEASCRPPAGYGDCGGDCDDGNAAAFKQVTCGVGWCKRSASGCSTVCTPGTPRDESCNAFDDDCDGVADNGTDLQLCGAPGRKCVAGICITGAGGEASGGGGSSPDGSGGASVTGSGGSASGGTGGAASAGSGGAVSGGSGGLEASSSAGGRRGSSTATGGCVTTPAPGDQSLGGIALSLVVLGAVRSRRRPRTS